MLLGRSLCRLIVRPLHLAASFMSATDNNAVPMLLLSTSGVPASIQSWAMSSHVQLPSSSNNDAILPLTKLRTQHLGRHVLYGESLPSTQTLLQRVSLELRSADVQPDFRLVCWTPSQHGGKGRGSNTWVSPQGCLTFSFQSSLSDGTSLPFAQYLVSLALVRTVKSFAAATPTSVYIKWPNDLYANNLKLGGILCQSEYFQGQFHVTTGIGINVSNNNPTICLNQLLPSPITKEAFLVEFCNVFEPMEEQFKAQGFAPFVEEYTANWLHTNQVVQVQGDKPGEPAMKATIQGLTDTGCLLATSDSGQKYELYPDGNSFDFFAGLLKRKL
ncbi:biotin-[acetyl-CoA-carboxylase] ligase [Aphanomyces invadans]|uniref:Biotin-[acetyl-CoA-carboxylase] ligase n=1 Tax=Aphanomyces invadans TaxID=157072 RepID=A0A024UG36_9STRA|nr:biotin-[acetyl-CoA-carboxylase] ligase [Aphanomyces invadans]ETW04837.1 biotin-[acetyl-CoA-carboxylase] ligase [Aphanomyces invadans]|eukprot:XP_008866275.1 biotin-[acetyl-CoA-carboxylase] ligase [Aphanomyces invadans]